MKNTFEELDQLLLGHCQFWRFEPFHRSLDLTYPWDETHPKLSLWLNQLSPSDIDSFKTTPSLLVGPLSAFIPELNKLSTLIELPEMKKHSLELDSHLFVGIPGRKLMQIRSMGEVSTALHRGSEWLEWCSGKGYLGRILAARTGQKVVSLEYQAALCESGQQIADTLGLPMQFVQGDALSKQRLSYMNNKQHAVALHACGDLHVNLLYKASQEKLPAVTISPCCYHLIGSDTYQAMSKVACSSTLKLSKHELRIPLQETVTGGERVKRHRFLEMSYRLGFDLLTRELKLSDEYLPIPSIKKSQLALGFESFCQWAAGKKTLVLPRVDFDEYLQRGIERFWQMERISLVQQLFRRPLELWIVLDKALYLEESGYHVSLYQFCSRETTPRNILLHAYRD